MVIIKQMKDGDSLVPLILVETILGLDSTYLEELHQSRGSPLNLHIWLDVANMVDGENEYIAPPSSSSSYGHSNFLSKSVSKTKVCDSEIWSNSSATSQAVLSVRIVIGGDLLQFLDLPVQTIFSWWV